MISISGQNPEKNLPQRFCGIEPEVDAPAKNSTKKLFVKILKLDKSLPSTSELFGKGSERTPQIGPVSEAQGEAQPKSRAIGLGPL